MKHIREKKNGIFKKATAMMLTIAMLMGLCVGGVRAAGTDVDFTENFDKNGVTIIDGKTGNPLAANDVKKDQNIIINFKYTVKNKDLVQGTNYTFELPDYFKDLKAFKIVSSVDKTTVFANGTVSVSGGKCIATLVFTQEAYDDGSVLAVGGSGTFSIACSFDESKVQDDTTKIIFFDGTTSVTVIPLMFAFTQIESTAAITNVPSQDAADVTASRIKWTVTVKPDMKNLVAGVTKADKLSDFVVTNTIEDGLTLITGNTTDTSLNPAITCDQGTSLSGSFDTSTTGTLTYKFPNPHTYVDGETYTITYYTTYDLTSFAADNTKKYTNKASTSYWYAQYDHRDANGKLVLSNTKKEAAAEKSEFIELTETILTKSYDDSGWGKGRAITNPVVKWKLEINQSKKAFKPKTPATAVDIVDTIPAGLKVKKVTLTTEDGTATVLTKDAASNGYTYTDNAADAAHTADFYGGTLTVPADIDAKSVVIDYETEIDPIVWKKGGKVDFANGVKFEALYNGTGYGFDRKKTATINFTGDAGAFLSGSGVYDTTDHSINWTVNVSGSKSSFTNGVLTVTIPNEQIYTPTTPTLTGSLAGATVTTNTATEIVITPSGTVSTVGQLQFKTTVKDANLWATNQKTNKILGVTAKLDADDGIAMKHSLPAVVKSTVLTKSGGQYDYATKQIEWTMKVNENKMAMTNIEITDTLPEGVSLVFPTGMTAAKDALTVTDCTVSDATYDETSRKLTIKLNDLAKGSTPPTIKFSTLVDESKLQISGADKTAPIENTATISMTEKPTSLVAPATMDSSATVNAGSAMLKKKGTLADDNQTIVWAVDVNPNCITMSAGTTIIDDFAEGLYLDEETVELFNATVDANGALAVDGNAIDAAKYDLTGTKDDKLVFKFKEAINSAYILKFKTDNTLKGTQDIKNVISYSGSAPMESAEEVVKATVVEGAGVANAARGEYKIQALRDDNTTPIANIHFTLKGAKNRQYKAVSNAQGWAYFGPLKFDAYTVTVDTMSSGNYVLKDDAAKFNISHANKTVEDKVHYATKVTLTYDGNTNTDGVPLTLTKDYATGATVTVDGDNTLKKDNHTFIGWNTKADGTGKAYAKNGTFLINADTTLYAQWKFNTVDPQPPAQEEQPQRHWWGGDWAPAKPTKPWTKLTPATVIKPTKPANKPDNSLEVGTDASANPKTGDGFFSKLFW